MGTGIRGLDRTKTTKNWYSTKIKPFTVCFVAIKFIYLSRNLIYHMFLGLWSEISLFHKLIYDIAQGSNLIG